MTKSNFVNIKIEANDLSDRFTLRRMHFRCPSGFKTNKVASATVAEVHGIKDPRRAKTQINIFSTGELENVKSHAKRSRNNFDLDHGGWGDGYRLIANAELDAFKLWSDEVVTENKLLFRTAVTSIQEQKERDRIELSEGDGQSLYNPGLYPSESSCWEKYDFIFEIGLIPDPHRDVRVGASREQVERFRNELVEQHNQKAKDSHLGIVGRLCESVDRFIERMGVYDGKKKGSFNDTLVTNMLSLATLIKSMNIYDDPRVDKVSHDILDVFAHIKAGDLREDEDLRQSTRKSAEDVRDALSKLKSSKY